MTIQVSVAVRIHVLDHDGPHAFKRRPARSRVRAPLLLARIAASPSCVAGGAAAGPAGLVDPGAGAATSPRRIPPGRCLARPSPALVRDASGRVIRDPLDQSGSRITGLSDADIRMADMGDGEAINRMSDEDVRGARLAPGERVAAGPPPSPGRDVRFGWLQAAAGCSMQSCRQQNARRASQPVLLPWAALGRPSAAFRIGVRRCDVAARCLDMGRPSLTALMGARCRPHGLIRGCRAGMSRDHAASLFDGHAAGCQSLEGAQGPIVLGEVGAPGNAPGSGRDGRRDCCHQRKYGSTVLDRQSRCSSRSMREREVSQAAGGFGKVQTRPTRRWADASGPVPPKALQFSRISHLPRPSHALTCL